MDIENLVYSIIPLVLIIFFSWLFSVMGSRMKKQAEEGASNGVRSPGDQLLELFGKPDDEKNVAGEEGRAGTAIGRMPQVGKSRWEMYRDPQAPRVNAEPITPKWWGA